MSRSKQSSAAASSSRLVAGVVPSPADAQAALRTQLPELRSGQSVALLQELHILTQIERQASGFSPRFERSGRYGP